MPHLDINQNLSIYYQDINPSGFPTVVLLHGLGVSSESWQLQIPALIEAGFRVISPDIRGFGKSGFVNERINITDLAKDVSGIIQRLEIAPVHMVGISMGGVITLQTLLDNPISIGRAVLVNAFARLRPEKARTWFYFISRFLVGSLFGIQTQAHLVARNLFPSPDQEFLRQEFCNQLMTANPNAYRKITWALATFDVRHRLSQIHTPTLILSGERDMTVPLRIQTELANGIPNSRQLIIPGVGHAMIVEQPEQVNQVLLDFLQA